MAPLARAKWRGFVNRVRGFYGRSPFQFVLVMGMGLFLAFVLFVFFYSGFNYIRRFPELEDVVVRYVFSLLFFAIFLMLGFSGVIITYSIMYRSNQASFLLALPVPSSSIFFISFLDSVVFSSWAFMFMACPVLFAYGLSFGLNILFYPVTLAALIPFVLIPASIAGILVLLIGLLPVNRKRGIIIGLCAVILVPVVYVGIRLFLAEKQYGMMEVRWVEEVFKSLGFSRSLFLPSMWASEIVISFNAGSYGPLAFYFLVLLSNGLFCMYIAHLAASGLYIRAWNVVRNYGSTRRYTRQSVLMKGIRSIPFLSSKVKLVIEKDVKSFIRDPAQWSQFLIFFGIIALYFFNLRSFAYDETSFRWKSIISFLNLSAVAMTLATLNSRFVFPQVSLEGRKFWILGLMPVTKKDIVMGKFYFAFFSGWLVSSALILLSDVMLRIDWYIRIVHLYTVFLVSFGLAGISVGSGAIWPDFRETVPSKIVSGLGGTLNLIISVFFVLFIIFTEAIPFHYYLIQLKGSLSQSRTPLAVILSVAACFSMGTGLAFLWTGIRRFRRMEVF